MLNFSKSLVLLVLFAIAVSSSLGADEIGPKRYAADPALIEVLPPYLLSQCSPASINLDQNFYDRYRTSMAFLIRQQPLYLRLLRQSSLVQQTQWFKSAGLGEEAEIVLVTDLNKYLNVSTPADTMLITVSMACINVEDAVLITNEIVNLFITRQETKSKSVLLRKLATLHQQLGSMQAEMRQIENTLDGIRQGTEFSFIEADLKDHYLADEYSGLLGKKNELELEIAGLETEVDLLRRKVIEEADAEALKKQTSKKPAAGQRSSSPCASCETEKECRQAQDKLIVLSTKLDVVNKLIVVSRQKLKSLSLIRADYLKVKNQRDGMRVAAEEMESKIRDISILHDDAELSRVKILQMADESLIVRKAKKK